MPKGELTAPTDAINALTPCLWKPTNGKRGTRLWHTRNLNSWKRPEHKEIWASSDYNAKVYFSDGSTKYYRIDRKTKMYKECDENSAEDAKESDD